MQLEPVIGLEIHAQLKTASKLFCGCDNRGELAAPNSTICPICVGHPGTLPSPNQRAVEFGILLGLALNCTISARLKFDRKHYFYPDIPKGYQISQFDEPLCANGFFEFDGVRIRIERSHLEEDAAKSFHQHGETLVDFNRCGTPLMETVTAPDFTSPQQARAFLQELRSLVRALGISEGDMENGNLRCDANISLRPVGDTNLYAKTEIKNINSFRSVERALEFEIVRQTELWKNGTPPQHTSTRNWNDVEVCTTESRTKEAAHDYRFFSEPDIPPFMLNSLVDSLRGTLPELPIAHRARLQSEYGFSAADARQLVDNEELGIFAEHVMSEFEEILPHTAKLVSGWLLSKYVGALNDMGRLFTQQTVTAENFAEFLTLISENKLSSTRAQQVLRIMIERGADPSQILEELGGSDAETPSLVELAEQVIAEFPKQVAEYRAGKTTVLQFLVGHVMKKSRGTADPIAAADELARLL